MQLLSFPSVDLHHNPTSVSNSLITTITTTITTPLPIHMWAYASRPPQPTDWLALRPTYPAWTDHHIAHNCCTDWVGSLPPDLLSDRVRCDLCGACHRFMVMANSL